MEIRDSPERKQFNNVKSMMRNIPPKETAGLGRASVRGYKRSPCPPAKINADVRTRSGPVVSVIRFAFLAFGENARMFYNFALVRGDRSTQP